jgi:hypothetical protein
MFTVDRVRKITPPSRTSFLAESSGVRVCTAKKKKLAHAEIGLANNISLGLKYKEGRRFGCFGRKEDRPRAF